MADYQEYALSEFKAHLSSAMDQVEAGETLIITRHGKQVARVVPEGKKFNRAAMDKATENLKKLKQEIAKDWKKRGLKPLTIEEIIEMKNEGRR